MTDPKAMEAARRIMVIEISLEPHDLLQFHADAYVVARALLAGEGNNATAAAVPIDPWQPIETAPKGLKLLLTYRNRLDKYRVVLGCYFEEGTLESSHEESGFAPAGWYEATEAYDELSPLDESPTCWCHIPAPPAGDANQQSKTGLTQASLPPAVRDGLTERLRKTTEEMANRCSVDMTLWNEHSNACLEAADAISSPPPVRDGMREALGAYHEAVEALLTLPEGGMRDLVVTRLADAHLAAKSLL